MNRKLILGAGRATSGKDTFAAYLIKKYPELFKRSALADLLKIFTFRTLKVFDKPIDSVEDLSTDGKKERYRPYMQQLATEVIRETFGQDFWCERIESSVREALESGFNVIITDIRFPNEVEYFKRVFAEYDPTLILIKRKSAELKVVTHSSENVDLIKPDIVIGNNGTLEEFYNKIDSLDLIKQIVPPQHTEHEHEHEEEESVLDIDLSLPEPDEDAEIVERSPPPTVIIPNVEEMTIICDGPDGDETETYANHSQHTAATDSKFINMMTTKNDKNSSQQLGVIGEQYVLELIQQHIRPKNETILVSTMPHVADIHSIDYVNNIFWVIEVKNKSNLTPEDVDKFKRDLDRMTKNNINNNLKVVGLFLSLRSLSIPRIGDVYISGNEIYLSKTFFTPETLRVVFDFVEHYKLIMTESKPQPPIPKAIEYTIPAQVLELFARLNVEYQTLNRELELYESMRQNCSTNLQHTEELIVSAQMKKRLIYCLNQQVSTNDDIIVKTTEDIQYNGFLEYVKSQSQKSNVQKKIILTRYPALTTQITRIGWNAFRDQAWQTAHKDDTPSKPAEQTEHVSIDDNVANYVQRMNEQHKLRKTDILKKYPAVKKDIERMGWKQWREAALSYEPQHVD